jgi:apolipoprotein N-acyltransferase
MGMFDQDPWLAGWSPAHPEVVHQGLGFCCFPWLVHDLEAWSFGHLYQTALALGILIPWYGLVAIGAYLAAWLARRLRDGRRLT